VLCPAKSGLNFTEPSKKKKKSFFLIVKKKKKKNETQPTKRGRVARGGKIAVYSLHEGGSRGGYRASGHPRKGDKVRGRKKKRKSQFHSLLSGGKGGRGKRPSGMGGR